MTDPKIYGYTTAGQPIDDAMIEALADEADVGYVPGQLTGGRRGRGRPLAATPSAEAAIDQWIRRHTTSATAVRGGDDKDEEKRSDGQ